MSLVASTYIPLEISRVVNGTSTTMIVETYVPKEIAEVELSPKAPPTTTATTAKPEIPYLFIVVAIAIIILVYLVIR